MAVLAYITDLFFQAKINQTAKLVGTEVKMISSEDQLLAALEDKPSLLIVDLNANGNPSSIVTHSKEKIPDLLIIAYFSHVQTELMESAVKAGADEVMPRSKFVRDLAKILSVQGPEAPEGRQKNSLGRKPQV